MNYHLAPTLYYIIFTKQPAYGVSAQLRLLGKYDWTINLPLWFNSLWRARKLLLCLKATEGKFSCNAVWQIDYIWGCNKAPAQRINWETCLHFNEQTNVQSSSSWILKCCITQCASLSVILGLPAELTYFVVHIISPNGSSRSFMHCNLL